MTIRNLGHLCLGLLLMASPAQAGNCLLDPAIRHTNGMPIASSEPNRTTSVSWMCNPDKLGYCGGHYYWPCCDSWKCSRTLAAAHGNYTPPEHTYKAWIGNVCPTKTDTCGSMDGVEPSGMATLGELPNNAMPGGMSGAVMPGGGSLGGLPVGMPASPLPVFGP